MKYEKRKGNKVLKDTIGSRKLETNEEKVELEVDEEDEADENVNHDDNIKDKDFNEKDFQRYAFLILFKHLILSKI
jgi:hypothetical protein